MWAIVMGGWFSSQPPEERIIRSHRRSSNYEKNFYQVCKEVENTIKILLLGACESGKSTLVKQMKIIYDDGYSINELNSFKSTIYTNLLISMADVVKAMNKLSIPFNDPINEECASTILNFPVPFEAGSSIPFELRESLMVLMQDKGFQECLHRAYDYQLNDSALYYFQKMERILAPEYIPNEQDVLRSRVQTIGLVETAYKIGKLTYRILDVGGVRSERRKWIHGFDDVKAVLFVAALSGYDMTLNEDGVTNRLEESLNLFQAICNNRFFENTSMILFLNKIDLFEEKILKSKRHLRLYFPTYIGPDHNVEAAAAFIQEQFQVLNMNEDMLIYSHFTIATDTDNVQAVFKVALEKIIYENLQATNLL